MRPSSPRRRPHFASTAALALAALVAAVPPAAAQEDAATATAGQAAVREEAGGPGDALAVAAEAERLARDDLWPGFRPLEIPLAVFDGERTFLFRHPAPPEGFAPLSSDSSVLVAEGLHEEVRANSFAPIGGALTAVVMLPMLEDYPTVRDRAGVVLHESFHVFEVTTHPEWTAPASAAFANPATDVILLALRRLESDALRRAVDEAARDARNGRDEASRLVASALEIRGERYRTTPPVVREYERGIELLEGLAQHVQVEATGSTAGLAAIPPTGFAPTELYFRGYATGLAMTRLLERLRPGWERGVESGEDASLEEALARAVAGVPAAEWRDRLPAAVQRAQADVGRLEAERTAARDSFLAAPGPRLVVLAPPGAPLALAAHDPMNVTPLGGTEVLHERWVRLRPGGDDLAGGRIEVLDGRALTLGVGPHPWAEGIRSVTVTGLERPPGLERLPDGTFRVEAGPLSATFADPDREIRVDEAGDEVRVLLPR